MLQDLLMYNVKRPIRIKSSNNFIS